MNAYTPRFRGVADGDAGDLEVRGSHRLLRLPDGGHGIDDADAGPAGEDDGSPSVLPAAPARRVRPRSQDATVLHLPPEGRDGWSRRTGSPVPSASPPLPEAPVFDDRPLRSRPPEPSPVTTPAPAPAVPPSTAPVPVAQPSAGPRPASVLPPRRPAPEPTPAPDTVQAEHGDVRPRARHADAPGAGTAGAATGPVLFGRRDRADDASSARPTADAPAPARAMPAAGPSVGSMPVAVRTQVAAPVPAAAAPTAAADSRTTRRRTRREAPRERGAEEVGGAGPAPVNGGPTTRRDPRGRADHHGHVDSPVDRGTDHQKDRHADADAPPRRTHPAARHRAAGSAVMTRGRTRLAVTGGTTAALGIAVLLWIVDGGPADLLSPALAVEAAGRLAGMVGSALLALLVVLAAGVPAIERAFGRARLLRWHVTVGAVSFSLVIVHVFLAVAASALVEGDSAFEAAWRLLSDFPGITLAAAGLALLVLVVSTSRRKARASRRRDAWHLLHLYGYLGVFLALPHQILTASLPAALYWSALYLVAAGAVVGWRVYLPLARSLRHQMVVSEIHQDSTTTSTVVLRGRHLDDLDAVPGSTLRLRFLDGRGWFAVHPGSVAAAPAGSRLRVTVPTADWSPDTVARGTWVLVEGPYGSLTADARTRPKLAVLAAGVGVAPVRAVLEEMPFDEGDVIVVHRVHDAAHAAFGEELAELAARRGIETIQLDGPRPDDRKSWLPASAAERVGDADAVTHLVPDIADRDVFVSGPPAWVDIVVGAVRASGVPSSRIHADSFAW